MTLYEAVERNHDCKEIALTFKGKKISFPTLLDYIDAYASKLQNFGVEKDMVVTLVSPNIPDTIYTFYALNKIGAISLIVHPLIPAKTLREAMDKTHSEIVILPDIRYHVYEENLKGKKTLLLSPKDDLKLPLRLLFPLVYRKELKRSKSVQYLDDIALSDKPVEMNKDDTKPSIYLRSGGTTGDSKTIVLNDKAINNIAVQCHKILEFTPEKFAGKKMLGVLPVFHGFGLAMGVHAPLANRATSALMLKFDAKAIVKMIKKNQLNFIILIPYMANKLLELKSFKGKGLKNLTHAFIGGDKTDLKIFERFDARMKEAGSDCILLEGYGLTETVTVNFVNFKSRRKVGSVGEPLIGVKARITNDKGTVLEPGQYGQIELCSQMLMIEYLDEPTVTSQVVTTDENGDKWLKTGDIGMLDNDGYLYFKQRQKEVFKIAGMNVFPTDIESRALRFKDVSTATCVFIDSKHPYVHLYLESSTENPSKLIEDIKELLNSELIKYSIPEKITILKTFPRTNVGKVDKKQLALMSQESAV